ncbi:hypothetical protein PsAD5_04051 [Pseudovibrio sp. Ad5]|nr:hypothetical protein PsAD5_04051 [Pseudovibrio sp. Ad5]
MSAQRNNSEALVSLRKMQARFWLRQSSLSIPPIIGSIPFSGGLQAKIALWIPAQPKRNPTDHLKIHLEVETKGYGRI